MLDIGAPFPDFNLPNENNQNMKLHDFSGKWLVLYVYPKDDTPGCTLEGKGFSASKTAFDRLNTVVVGLSADDPESHKNFCNKFGFTISLLADTNQKLLRAAQVGQSDYKGTMYWDRTTFVIDPKGILRKVYTRVKADGHDQELLKDLPDLQKKFH